MHDATDPHEEHEHVPEHLEPFYQRLLLLDVVADIEPVLADTLRLIVALTRSRLAYIEIVGDDNTTIFWRGYTADAASAGPIRSQISYGIVRRAITEARTIATSSAFRDERFLELSSVRQNAIGSVLCVPLGGHLPFGVVYLQGSQPFSALDRLRVETLARRLTRITPRLTDGKVPACRRLLDELRELQARRVTEAMERHDDNIAEVARELGVGRAFVYAVLGRIARSVSG